MPSIDAKLEKFIVERDSFKTAVREAFHKADLDGNGVLSPKETAAMTDIVFEHIERELKEYDLEFERPSQEVVKKLVHFADKNGNYVLDEDEFFEFYRQVIRYCATTAQRGWSRYLPPMIIGAFVTCFVKCSLTKTSSNSPSEYVPVMIVGSLLGLVATMFTGDKRLKKRFFGKPPGTTRSSFA